jgi:hypothetical protein
MSNENLSKEEKCRIFSLVKLASVVSGVVSVGLVILFPNNVTYVVGGVTTYASYEVYKSASNLRTLFGSYIDEQHARLSRKNMINAITCDAPVCNALLDVYAPDDFHKITF